MTKDEFIAGYCERSRIPITTFADYWIALPCQCGEEECNGWAAVPNNEVSIKTHMELYVRDGLEISQEPAP